MDATRSKDLALAEWQALRERNYGCEGIAAIVGVETVGAASRPRGDAHLAAAFRALADELATADADPSGVLEVLAARRLRRLARRQSGTRGAANAGRFPEIERMLADGPSLLAVNFHHTPPERAEDLARQLNRIARRFVAVDEKRLDAYRETGEWRGRPGVVLAFYNGYRSNFDVARPLLDRYGLTGWFFVVSGFVAEPVETQAGFAARNRMSIDGEGTEPGGRLAMSWDEVRDLDRTHHVVASHTRNHVDVGAGGIEALRSEIAGSQDDLRAALGHPVTAFAANRGGPYGQNETADRFMDEAGFRFVFSNLKIQRIGRPAGS